VYLLPPEDVNVNRSLVLPDRASIVRGGGPVCSGSFQFLFSIRATIAPRSDRMDGDAMIDKASDANRRIPGSGVIQSGQRSDRNQSSSLEGDWRQSQC
jgi:hypothetical protein